MRVALRWAFRPRTCPRVGSYLPLRNRITAPALSNIWYTRDVRRAYSSRKDEPSTKEQPSGVESVSKALRENVSNKDNDLLATVHIPEDPSGVLSSNHPVTSILSNSSIIVQRQLEMMNVFVGFEQANKYIIMGPNGDHIGYLAEEDHGIGKTMARQAFRTHRSFTAHVFDRDQQEVLRFHRPFSWISSRIRIYDAFSRSDAPAYTPSTALQGTSAQSALDHQSTAQTSSLPLSSMRIIGEAQQQWAPFRRKYNLFLARDLEALEGNTNAPQLTSGELPLSNTKALEVAQEDNREMGFAQFAYVDEPLLSWDFSLLSEDSRLLGSVNRNFAGFAREIFTDTGVYALRMDAAGLKVEPRHLISQTGHSAADTVDAQHAGMTLDQRAVMLATAVSIDFDYFSRHSSAGASGGMGFMPIWFPMGGGSSSSTTEGAPQPQGTGSERGLQDPNNPDSESWRDAPILEGAAGGLVWDETSRRMASNPNDQPGMADGNFARQHQPAPEAAQQGSPGQVGGEEIWGGDGGDPWADDGQSPTNNGGSSWGNTGDGGGSSSGGSNGGAGSGGSGGGEGGGGFFSDIGDSFF